MPKQELTQTGIELQAAVSHILPKTQGTGNKVDINDPTFPWHDLVGEIIVKGVGGASPSWSRINATDFFAYKFAVNDEVWINFHNTHDYTISTDVFKHVHWFTDGTSVNSVKWQYSCAYASRDTGHFDFASPDIITMEDSTDGVIYNHVVTEQILGSTIVGLKPDGIIACHLRRITNGVTDNTDGVFLSKCDVHYQSTGRGTKNSAEPFDV